MIATKRKFPLSVTVLLVLLIVGLLAGSLFFIFRGDGSDFSLTIGIPQTDSDGQITAIDFTRSKPLERPEDINTVVFSFVTGQFLQDSPPTVSPDALLSMTDTSRGLSFLVEVWLCEDSVIFTTDSDDGNVYRELKGTYADSLRSLVEQQIALYP